MAVCQTLTATLTKGEAYGFSRPVMNGGYNANGPLDLCSHYELVSISDLGA